MNIHKIFIINIVSVLSFALPTTHVHAMHTQLSDAESTTESDNDSLNDTNNAQLLSALPDSSNAAAEESPATAQASNIYEALAIENPHFRLSYESLKEPIYRWILSHDPSHVFIDDMLLAMSPVQKLAHKAQKTRLKAVIALLALKKYILDNPHLSLRDITRRHDLPIEPIMQKIAYYTDPDITTIRHQMRQEFVCCELIKLQEEVTVAAMVYHHIPAKEITTIIDEYIFPNRLNTLQETQAGEMATLAEARAQVAA